MSAAYLHILTGRAASGKSGWLFEKLKAHADRNEPAILLTEEQSTYEAEKAMAARYGGLLGTEVLSIRRFEERLLEEQGEPLSYLSPQGRCMVIRKVAAARRSELKLFARTSEKRGFAAEADALFTRLARSGVSPAQLRETADALGAGPLKDKLSDIAVLYGASETYLADKYLTEFSLTERAIACLPGSELAHGHIYIDSADLSGAQSLRLLGALLGRCLSMTAAVLADPVRSDEPLFQPGEELIGKLTALAGEAGVPCMVIPLRERSADGEKALIHLERYLFRERVRPFEEPTDAITLTACGSREAETERLAEEVMRLTASGVRCRDIAVTVTDPDGYLPLIRRAFRRRGIPLFDESPRRLSSHAAADLILSAVRFAARQSMEDALHVVKSGLTDVTETEAEIFENYVLRYGLYGSAVLTPFTFGEVPPEAESARKKLAAPLAGLKEALSREHSSAGERVRAVYGYLTALGVRAGLIRQADELVRAGNSAEAGMLSEIWNRLTEVLGQIYRILGDDPLPLKELPLLLEEGISSVTLSALPGQQDRVSVGDFERTRAPQRDILFLLGANEGLFPRTRPDDGLLSDSELEELCRAALPLWEDTEKLMARDRLGIYTVLSKARTGLYISYAVTGGDSPLAPAPLLQRFKEMFPKMRTDVCEDSPFPYYPEGAFARTVQDLVRFRADGTLPPEEDGAGLSERVEYFMRSEEYGERFRKLLDLNKATAKYISLGREQADRLYGKITTVSPSRLETFNKCPFQHYIRYGLRLNERPELREEASDTGTLLHKVLEEYVNRANALDPGLGSITPEQTDALIEQIMEEEKHKHNDAIYETDPRMAAALFLQTETAKRCAHAIVRQIRAGSFVPDKTEYEFGKNGVPGLPLPVAGEDIELTGTVDRIDRTEDGRFYRIIDYKTTASKEFKPAEIKAGLTLQLPLYLTAAAEGAVPAGMYYMPMNLAPAAEDKLKTNMLRGVTGQEEAVIAATEAEMTDKSAIIEGLKKTKEGFSGKVCGSAQLQELTDFARRRAARTAEEILSGNISVDPYEQGCKWCKFSTVCRIAAAEKRVKKLEKLDLKDLLSEIGEGTV